MSVLAATSRSNEIRVSVLRFALPAAMLATLLMQPVNGMTTQSVNPTTFHKQKPIALQTRASYPAPQTDRIGLHGDRQSQVAIAPSQVKGDTTNQSNQRDQNDTTQGNLSIVTESKNVHSSDGVSGSNGELSQRVGEDLIQSREVVLRQIGGQCVVDLGPIPSHETCVVNLRLKNLVEDELTIAKIKTDCGCLQAKTLKSQAAYGKSMEFQIQLAPSIQAGKTQRSVALMFVESKSHEPYQVLLETEVVTPITLKHSKLTVPRKSTSLIVRGAKRGETSILDCQAVRGSVRVTQIRADDNSFELTMESLIRFGRSSDLLRFRINHDGRPVAVDIPIEIRSDLKAQCLPSSAVVDWQGDRASIRSRLVLLPNHGLRIGELQVRVDPSSTFNAEVDVLDFNWKEISPVLLELHATLKARPNDDGGVDELEGFGSEWGKAKSKLVVYSSDDSCIASQLLIHRASNRGDDGRPTQNTRVPSQDTRVPSQDSNRPNQKNDSEVRS